jgi:hypothetical protein
MRIDRRQVIEITVPRSHGRAGCCRKSVKYVFLAPDDYDVSFADVVAPTGATLMLDGAAVTATPTAIAGTQYQVYRLMLGAGNGGVHTLVGDQPFGVQVIGYGSYTSYQYPAGLNLLTIVPPPPPIN